jgi:hypothetical protein
MQKRGLHRESAFVILRANMALRYRRRAAALAVALFAASACGHPASEAECQVIVERIVELEMKAQNVTDPAEIAKRKDESLGLGDAGAAMGSDVLKGCIGKHVTDRAILCVREAKSASEITDRCLQ